MSLSFFKDYEKVNKSELTPTPETQGSKEPNVPNMSVDDMKSYFDTMRESLIADIREEIKNYREVANDASNADLSTSEQNSIEPAVDR